MAIFLFILIVMLLCGVLAALALGKYKAHFTFKANLLTMLKSYTVAVSARVSRHLLADTAGWLLLKGLKFLEVLGTGGLIFSWAMLFITAIIWVLDYLDFDSLDEVKPAMSRQDDEDSQSLLAEVKKVKDIE